jgi:Tol biopolymer transport system component
LVVVAEQSESVDVHGGSPKPIVFSETCRESPCDSLWFLLSPNREYAAVTTQDGGGVHNPFGIQVVQMKPGRDPVVLQMQISGEQTDQVLAFSPDSRQLVYRHCQDMGPPPLNGCFASELMAAPLPGGTPVPLAQSGIPGAGLVPSDVQQVQWSRNGRWLAFIENGSLEVVPTTGASAPRILATCVAPNVLSEFSWSPTSKLVAYDCLYSQSTDLLGRLMTVRPDGTHRTNLLANRLLKYAPVFGERMPQWSPDGSRLLLLGSYTDGLQRHLWSIHPDGRHLTRLG